ncbi:MAG TPA: hypothetical protein VHZ50_04045, partial [Puia sp.]|nr:hypothetical protein [Puia sp.]
MIFHLLAIQFVLGQKPNSKDYKVYLSLIKSEILDTTKSVAIIKKSIKSQEVKEHTSIVVQALKLESISSLYSDVYSWTESDSRKSPSKIDSVTQNEIINYCEDNFNDFNFIVPVDSTNFKISIIKKIHVKG